MEYAALREKKKKTEWAVITLAIMTAADVTDHCGCPILAQIMFFAPTTPFNFDPDFINRPSRAIDPGLISNADFNQ